MEYDTLHISSEVKIEFEKERLMFREKNERFITQDEFLVEMIKHWRKK
jgi:hypothetical protein